MGSTAAGSRPWAARAAAWWERLSLAAQVAVVVPLGLALGVTVVMVAL